MIQPLHDRLLLKPIQEELESGLIMIAKTDKDKPQKVEVIAVGEDCKLKVGNKLILSRFAADEIEIDGEIYLITREFNILAKLNA